MDYSAAIHQDSDDPAGSSPWASSPQQARRSLSNDEPPALDPALPQPVNNISTEPIQEEPGTGDASLQTPPNGQANGQPSQQQQEREQYSGATQSQHPQQRPSAQQRYHAQRPVSRQEGPHYKLSARVTGLERPGRKDPIIRFDIYTNLPGFRTTQFRDVRRTHSEFGKLADHLVASTPEAIVPALPPSATPAGVGTEEDETRVKAYMQRWLNVVCANRQLMRDDEIIRFVEGDPGYSPVIKKSQPATGARRKYLKQFAPPPDDTPELFEARPVVKSFYLGTMDAGQKVERAVKAKKGLGLAESDYGEKLTQLADQELHPGLKNACRRLGRTLQTIGDLHAVQAIGEATTLEDPLNYSSADSYIVKETLTNRHILLRELLQAQTTTRSKLSATERLRSSSSVRRDKVDEAIAALDEARSNEQHLAGKTQRVTFHLLQEQRKWFDRTSVELRAAIKEYVIREIEAERRCLTILEAVRPDIRAIDASGGLSRLGREATPVSNARRSALAASQGPKGDAWSGAARRSDAALKRSVSGSFAGQSGGGDVSSSNKSGGLDEDGHGKDSSAKRNSSGRQRALSGASSQGSLAPGDDDDDRVDARNAASRLAQSTF